MLIFLWINVILIWQNSKKRKEAPEILQIKNVMLTNLGQWVWYSYNSVQGVHICQKKTKKTQTVSYRFLCLDSKEFVFALSCPIDIAKGPWISDVPRDEGNPMYCMMVDDTLREMKGCIKQNGIGFLIAFLFSCHLALNYVYLVVNDEEPGVTSVKQ